MDLTDGEAEINKALVQRYAAELRDAGISAASIYQSLSAIRKLALEASDNGAFDSQIANGIRQEGTRTGNWLTKQDAQKVLNAPDTDTLKGPRDRAVQCSSAAGLRRAEAANLAFEHIQQRDGRWVLVDLIGNGSSRCPRRWATVCCFGRHAIY